MSLGQEYAIFGEWFIIHFTENPGMAFGMAFGGDTGKLILSLFRVAAVIGIGFWIRNLIRQKAHPGFITAIAFIFAGALGNILDSLFYGVLFNSSEFQVASFFAEEGGYAPMLYGQVVDMLYFPLFEGTFPDWFPIWGGEHFLFFRPVFNVADVSITTGVGLIVVGQRKFFGKKDKKKPLNEAEEQAPKTDETSTTEAVPENEPTPTDEPEAPQSEPHS